MKQLKHIKYKTLILFFIIGMIISLTSQCELTKGLIKSFVPMGGLIVGSAEAVQKLHEAYKAYTKEFTPKEEYYIGRSVSASLLQKRRIYSRKGNTPIESYIAKIGNTLAMASNLPETYQGYRFIVLKSRSINAFAVPSGYIFITTKLIETAANEDEIAGALAHEVSHVVLRHPTKSISSARKTEIVLDLIKYGASKATSKNKLLNSLTKSFGGVLDDIGKSVLKGYDKDAEKEADLAAVQLMINAGYNPKGLSAMLRKLKVGGGVHGSPKDRARDVDNKIATYSGKIPKMRRYRKNRFKDYVRKGKIRKVKRKRRAS